MNGFHCSLPSKYGDGIHLQARCRLSPPRIGSREIHLRSCHMSNVFYGPKGGRAIENIHFRPRYNTYTHTSIPSSSKSLSRTSKELLALSTSLTFTSWTSQSHLLAASLPAIQMRFRNIRQCLDEDWRSVQTL